MTIAIRQLPTMTIAHSVNLSQAVYRNRDQKRSVFHTPKANRPSGFVNVGFGFPEYYRHLPVFVWYSSLICHQFLSVARKTPEIWLIG
jgi:hypothetical protein